MLTLSIGLSRLSAGRDPCQVSTKLLLGAKVAAGGYGVYEQGKVGIDKLYGGDIAGGLLDLAQAGATVYNMRQELADLTKSCFGAGTPLLTPGGAKPVEQFVVGDLVLSRDERDPEGVVAAKVVEEVFVRTGEVVRLSVGGRGILTTPEHPFWVRGKGWKQANELAVGDELSSHDGRWVAVESVEGEGEYATVYNLRVADYHTYFVGDLDWGFSVWAHNSGQCGVNGTGTSNPNSHGEHDPEAAFEDLARMRNELGMPQVSGNRTRDGVLGRLDLNGRQHYGMNSWAGSDQAAWDAFADANFTNPRTGNPPLAAVANHAEGDAVLQAFKAGNSGGGGVWYLDGELCGFCGRSGGLRGLAYGLGLTSLAVYERLPNGSVRYTPNTLR
jgi:hypothetical protein